MSNYLTYDEIKDYRDKLREEFISLVPEYQKIKAKLFDIARLYFQVNFYLDPEFLDLLSQEIKVSKKYLLNILNGTKLTERIVFLLYEFEKKHISGIPPKAGGPT